MRINYEIDGKKYAFIINKLYCESYKIMDDGISLEFCSFDTPGEAEKHMNKTMEIMKKHGFKL